MIIIIISSSIVLNTHLDGAGVFNAPTPLPLFQSWRNDNPTAANKHECLFHRPTALTLRASVTIDISGMGGILH